MHVFVVCRSICVIYFIDKLSLSRREVEQLELVVQDVSVQRTRLEELLEKIQTTNDDLEEQLKVSHLREEQFEEQLEESGSKIFTLEESLFTAENQVRVI